MTGPLEPPDDDVVFLEDDGRDEVRVAVVAGAHPVDGQPERLGLEAASHRAAFASPASAPA